MQRVTKGIPATLNLHCDIPPVSGTLTVTRDRDAVIILNSVAVTVGTDHVSRALPAQPDEANLTATWTIARADGTATISEPVEVVTQRACSVDDCRRLKPMDDSNRYPDAVIESAISQLESEMETAAGVSFTGRESVVTVDGNNHVDLFLPVGRPRTVRSILIDDVPMTADQLAGVKVDERQGVLYRSVTWPQGRLNIKCTVTAGLPSVPGLLPSAMAKAVRYLVVDSPASDRAISVTNEDGTTQSLVVSGVRGALFSIPELNVIVSEHRQQFGLA